MKTSGNKARHIGPEFNAKGKRFGIVVSRFNEYLTRQLLEGATETLMGHGAKFSDIHVLHVPGAFEIPLTAQKLVKSRNVDAVITLAVVIQGETKHFDQVVNETARGLRELSQTAEVPVILGMIPAKNVEQAIERVGIKQMNKGREWALSAIEMANLMRHPLLKKKSSRK